MFSENLSAFSPGGLIACGLIALKHASTFHVARSAFKSVSLSASPSVEFIQPPDVADPSENRGKGDDDQSHDTAAKNDGEDS